MQPMEDTDWVTPPKRGGDKAQEVRIAECFGDGSGQFLVRSLTDPLQAGSMLCGVVAGGDAHGMHTGFFFSVDDSLAFELIRARLDGHDRVIGVELLRTRQMPPPARYTRSRQLLEFLVGCNRIHHVRMASSRGEPWTILLGDEADPYVLEPTDFVSVLAGRERGTRTVRRHE